MNHAIISLGILQLRTGSKIAQEGSTKIILATDSRHIFDALTRSSMTDVVWLKQGAKQEKKDSEDLSILLDLGALDSCELLTSNKCKVVVLTEDSKSERLRTVLDNNGFPKDEYMLQSYDGVSNVTMAATIADFFLKQGNNTRVLIHRDGDCMLPTEVAWYVEKESKKLSDRSELFVTPLTDIEHQFCKPAHIAEALGMSFDDAEKIIGAIITANGASLTADFANKRAELKNKTLKQKQDTPTAADLLDAQISFEQVKGKRLFGLLVVELQKLGLNPMHLSKSSVALSIEQLQNFAAKVWPTP